MQELQKIRDENIRIIVADIEKRSVDLVLCLAYDANMTSVQNYVWFLPDWVAKTWMHRKLQQNVISELPCSIDNIDAALEGHFALSQQFYGPDDAPILENPKYTVKQWKDAISSDFKSMNLFSAPSYLGFVYDAVYLYALALRDRIRENPEFPLNLKYNLTNMESLARSIEKTRFSGASGLFRIGANASRITNKKVLQWINSNWSTVFLLNNEDPTQIFSDGPDTIHWANQGVPSDGSPNLLTMRILFVLCSFLVVAAVAVIAFLYSMHRYSSKLSRAYEVLYLYFFFNNI